MVRQQAGWGVLKVSADFVAPMEDGLDLYGNPTTPNGPWSGGASGLPQWLVSCYYHLPGVEGAQSRPRRVLRSGISTSQYQPNLGIHLQPAILLVYR